MSKMQPLAALCAALLGAATLHAQDFRIGPEGYFRNEGVDVMAFYDFYPEGHQGGVCVIMNGNRVATNGDLRFEATPGQWQPVPRQISREVGDRVITATLAYPDSSRHLTGFNPMIYPDVVLQYTVTTRAVGDHIEVTLDLDRPIPDASNSLTSGSRPNMCWAAGPPTTCSWSWPAANCLVYKEL